MIVWISSYPKSGNTWARLLLSAYVYDSFDINSIDIGTADTSSHPYQLVSPIPFPTPEVQPLLRHAALMHTLFLIKQRPVFCKTHCANGFIGSVSLFPPELTRGAVYIVRDPRDAVISFAEHMGISIDQAIENFADDNHATGGEHEIVSLLTSWSHNVRSWSEKREYPIAVIRYEDMLTDTLGCLKQMLKVSGMQVNEKRAKRAVEACQLSRLRKAENDGGFSEASGKAETFFKRGISGGWRDVLTDEQAVRIEQRHGEVMEKHGYHPSIPTFARKSGMIERLPVSNL